MELTITEQKIKEMLATGKESKDIAQELHISIHTMRSYERSIAKKTRNRHAG